MTRYLTLIFGVNTKLLYISDSQMVYNASQEIFDNMH